MTLNATHYRAPAIAIPIAHFPPIVDGARGSRDLSFMRPFIHLLCHRGSPSRSLNLVATRAQADEARFGRAKVAILYFFTVTVVRWVSQDYQILIFASQPGYCVQSNICRDSTASERCEASRFHSSSTRGSPCNLWRLSLNYIPEASLTTQTLTPWREHCAIPRHFVKT